ncbi:MAG TPA: hypothetical protein VNT57_01535 [Desulfobacteria bacterium]|nr:hypothetical protein [Desulfobacteria bacterium]
MTGGDFAIYASTFFLVLAWCFLLTAKNSYFKRFAKFIGRAWVLLFPLSVAAMLMLTMLYLKTFFGITPDFLK